MKESANIGKKHRSVSYQDQAPKLVSEQKLSQADGAKQLGIHPVTLRGWLPKCGQPSPSPAIEPDHVTSNDPTLLKVRIQELERQLRRPETEAEQLTHHAARPPFVGKVTPLAAQCLRARLLPLVDRDMVSAAILGRPS